MARVPQVLVVDQDPQARFEVKQLVRQARLGVAGEAGFGTEAVSLAAETKPDVILCGISRPPDRALQTIEALLDVLPETPVVIYAPQQEVEVVRKAMLVGARDFLVMPADVDKFANSVRSVLELEERRRLRLSGQAKGMGPKGLVISIFGAKGGVGKSTISTNLAVALAGLGQSTVLVDADNAFGDVSSMLDLRPERSVVDLVRDIESVERANVEEYLIRHASGLWVLPAPRQSLLWRSVTPDAMRRVIDLVARRFDIVLIDSAAMLSDLSLMVLEEANMVLWVTSADFSSINNSVLGLEALRQMNYPEARVRLVLNATRADDAIRSSKIEEVLKRQFFWTVPYDRAVRLGTQLGAPAVQASPESNGSRTIVRLAQALTGATASPEPSKQSGISRLFRRKDTAASETETSPDTIVSAEASAEGG